MLSQLGIYSEEFAKQIAPSAGLRNRLVHEYNNTRLDIIYKSVGEAIQQYAKYCDSILKFIEKQRTPRDLIESDTEPGSWDLIPFDKVLLIVEI